jgi:hypothetical protein
MLCFCRTSHSLVESDEGADLDDPATAADYFSSRRLHPAGRDGTPSSSRAGTSSSSRAGTSSSSRADTASSSRAGPSNSSSSPRRASPDKNFRREVGRRRHLSSSCSPSRAGTGSTSSSSPRRTGTGSTSSSSPRRAGAGSSSSPRRAGTGVDPGAGSSPTRAGPLLGTVGEPSRLGALYKIPKKRPQGERTATFEQVADPGCLSRIIFSITDLNFFHPGSASKN